MKGLLKGLLILVVGTSGMLYIALTGKRNSLFDFVAPSPIVFSYGRNFVKKESRLEFSLTSKSGSVETLKFNRKLYRELDGTHHLKLLYHYFMSFEYITRQRNYHKFLQDFLCQRMVQNQETASVQLYKRSELIYSYDCK